MKDWQHFILLSVVGVGMFFLGAFIMKWTQYKDHISELAPTTIRVEIYDDNTNEKLASYVLQDMEFTE